jgi:hypothetical protein
LKASEEGQSIPLNGVLNISNDAGDNNYHLDDEKAKRHKVDVNNNLSNDNKEYQLSQSTLNISGANDLLLKQIEGYLNQKYPDFQNKMEIIKEKWKEIQKRIPVRSPKMNIEISKNMDGIHHLLPGAVNASAVQQPSANPASPLSPIHRSQETLLDSESRPNSTGNIFTDTNLTSHPQTQGRSDKVQVDSSCEGVERMFKIQVRQSLLE